MKNKVTQICRLICIGCSILFGGQIFAAELIPFSITAGTIVDGKLKIAPLHGYMDKQGNAVINPKFEIADKHSSNGLARVRVGNKWGFVDRTGKVVIPAKFEEALSFSTAGIAFAKYGGRFGVIDANGNWLLLPVWVDVQPMFATGDKWYAAVKTANGWRVFSDSGYATNAEYVDVLPFSNNGFVPVRKGMYWGFEDLNGFEIVPPKYERISWNVSKTGTFAARSNGGWGLVNINGDVIVPFVYAEISWFFGPDDEVSATARGSEKIEIGSQVVYLKKNGERLVNQKFDWATSFNSDGVSIANIANNFYFVSHDGKITELGEYQEFVSTSSPGVFRFIKKQQCPMFVDADLKPLPGWVTFLSSMKESNSNEKIAKAFPIVSLLGCIYFPADMEGI